MNRFTLLLRSLVHHRGTNLLVLAGAIVGSAVLTGALLVGDSLRGSLHERAERQLGGVDCLLAGSRFVRDDIAQQLPGTVIPAVLLQGSLRCPEKSTFLGQVNVYGGDHRAEPTLPWLDGSEPGVALSAEVARRLQVGVGDTIRLGVQKEAVIPRSSVLGRRTLKDTVGTIALPVKAILPPDSPAANWNFSLRTSATLNILVPLAVLQREIGQTGKVNALLASGESAKSLNSALAKALTLTDAGLSVEPAESGKAYLSVQTDRLLLEANVVAAAESAAKELGVSAMPTLVYLANRIRVGSADVPYSLVACVDPNVRGVLQPVPENLLPLADDAIVLAGWKDSPFRTTVGETVTIEYFQPETETKAEEAPPATFQLKGTVAIENDLGRRLEDARAADKSLTPPFKGITDKASLKSWDPPFPYENERVKQTDEEFWRKHKTTPKAYITLAAGRKLFGSRFGNVTSVRVAAIDQADAYRAKLLAKLDPDALGLRFEPIRERLLTAGAGSTDFGMLFLGFSFFLILAALLLVGLLFRLALDRRAAEVGLLRAVGFPMRTVRRQLLGEGILLAAIGSVLGVLAALLYTRGLIAFLAYTWPDRSAVPDLRLHVTAMSLGIGFVASVGMSGLAILWALRILAKSEPAELLKGTLAAQAVSEPSRCRRPMWVAIGAALCGVLVLAMGPFLPAGEPRAGAFFGSGFLFLSAGLALLWRWLKLPSDTATSTVPKLGIRNVRRQPTRSLTTAGLLAAAAFLLVAVEAFHRSPDKEFAQPDGGSGGFALVADTASALHFDPRTPEGTEEMRLTLSQTFQRPGVPAAQVQADVEREMALITGSTLRRFRVEAGDDASCLNLFQASRPRVLGVSEELIDQGKSRFRFAATQARTEETQANPWLLLRESPRDGVIFPAFAEENTAMWMLKKGLGEVFTIPGPDGKPVQVVLRGLLKDSVFQSELLMGDANFRKAFPRSEGFRTFLIDPGPNPPQAVASAYAMALAPFGMNVTPSADRLATFLAVQNTYLTTFQLLGGMGLVLGTCGLAVVLLRNVRERRAELALLRAVGYRAHSIRTLLVTENGTLLVFGLALGAVAAAFSVLPHVALGGDVPWLGLGGLLLGTFMLGFVVILAAARSTESTPIVPALRNE